MASGDFGVSPEGRDLEPRREGVSDSMRGRFRFEWELALRKSVDAEKAEYSAAPIYLIERRAIQLRRYRWQEALPPQTDHPRNAERQMPEIFAEYVRPPPDREQLFGFRSNDRPNWFIRLLRRWF